MKRLHFGLSQFFRVFYSMVNSQFTFLALRSCASTQQLQHASLKKCCARDKLCCDFACRVSHPVVGPFYIAQAD